MVTYDTTYTSIEQSDMPNILLDFFASNMVIAIGLMAFILFVCLFNYARRR